MRLAFPHDGGALTVEIAERNFAGVARAGSRAAPLPLEELLARALASPVGSAPLAERVRPGNRVAVIFDDATRPTPTGALFPLVAAELARAGVRESDVYPVYGPGLHRPPDPRPVRKYGEALFQHPNLVVHDHATSPLVFRGVTSRGVPIFLNRIVEEVDFRISLGHIVPHMDAGYGGGGKLMLPGIAGKPSVEQNHAFMIAPASRLGKLDGNPVREDMDEAGRLGGLDFVVNTVADADGRVAAVAAGDAIAAHRWGCRAKQDLLAYPLDGPVDVAVVLEPDGYLGRAMAAMLWADRAVRLGGSIILVAPCRLGWADGPSMEARLTPEECLIKQSAAELARIVANRDIDALRLATAVFNYRRTMLEKHVTLVSARYDPAETAAFGLDYAPDLGTALAREREREGPDARVLFMPETFRTYPVLPKLEGVVWDMGPGAALTAGAAALG